MAIQLIIVCSSYFRTIERIGTYNNNLVPYLIQVCLNGVYFCIFFIFSVKKVHSVSLIDYQFLQLPLSFLAQTISIIETKNEINSKYKRLEFRGNLGESRLSITDFTICFSLKIDKFTRRLQPILDLVENSGSSNIGRTLQLSLG